MDKYADVFAEKPSLCYEGVHEIHVTSDFKPQRLQAYKVPELLKPEVSATRIVGYGLYMQINQCYGKSNGVF